MPSSATIVKILWRYKQGEELCAEELAELRLWLMESPRHEELFSDLSNTAKWDHDIEKWKNKDPNATWNKILQRVEAISPETFKRKKKWRRYMAAASVMLIFFSTAIYFWLDRKQSRDPEAGIHETKMQNILPAKGSAMLTLSNGNSIPLDSLAAGMHTRQGSTDIIKTDSAALAYHTTTSAGDDVKYNTLVTSKGNQYHLILSDGTSVWLNAASSIRFPVSFTGSIRQVELSGEGYFEVTKNKLKPFIVQTIRSASIRVLGTHFNVGAYPDEPAINTTLLEGSVSVSNGKDSVIIKTGEVIRLDEKGQLIVTPANLEQSVAWKNKLFWFTKASFEEVMRQLARWYDINVVYKGEIKQSYTGILPVNLPLSDVLHILEKGGNVHFTIEEKNKVTVRP